MKPQLSPRINIVTPDLKAAEQKLRINEISSKTYLGKPSAQTPRKSSASITRQKSASAMPMKPLEMNEIHILNSSKELIMEILAKLNQIVIENETTPEVQNKLSPLLESIKENYSRFNSLAIQYFKNYNNIHETTQTPQVLSTAFVKNALEDFLKSWIDLEKVIDRYAESHPPPHLKEISAKFGAIKSSLEIIYQTNAQRKFPNLALGKSVLSIQALCDSITEAVYELFMQERFPNFQVDSLQMYKEDVRSFLRVVSDAFYNIFPQSGVPLCDLSRIKLNVVASCNEIIEGLKAAFAFPNTLKAIQKLKDRYNNEMKPIFDVLESPYNIVKPKPWNEAPPTPASTPKTQEEITLERIKSDNVEQRLNNMPPERKVELFLFEVLPFFNSNLKDFEDPWEGLLYVNVKMKDFVQKYNVNGNTVENLTIKINNLKDKLKDNDDMMEQKNKIISKLEAKNKKEAEEMQKHIDNLSSKIKQLNNDLDEKQDEIERYAKINHEFRLGLEDIANDINQRLKEPIENNFSSITYTKLIKTIFSLEDTFAQDQQIIIDELKAVQQSLESKISDLKESQKKSKRKNFTEEDKISHFNSDILIFDSEPRNELMVAFDKETVEPGSIPLSNSRLFPQALSSGLVMRRADEPVVTQEDLTNAHHDHFSDLRKICKDLDELKSRGFRSEHIDILFQTDDLIPEKSRSELMALLNDLIESAKALFKTLLNNDTENTNTIRKLSLDLNEYKIKLSEALHAKDQSIDIESEDSTQVILKMAVNIISQQENPLHDKILELTEELKKRDLQSSIILSRLFAISRQSVERNLFFHNDLVHEEKENQSPYYEIKQTTTNSEILSLLGKIQDEIDDLISNKDLYDNKSKSYIDFLYEIENRLRKGVKGTSSSEDEKNESTFHDNDDKQLIQTIYKYCDILTSPRFSNEFIGVNDLNKMFQKIINNPAKHPREYIPPFVEKYVEMKASVDSTLPYLSILSEIFQGYENDSYYNNDDLINTNQVILLQDQVSKMNEELSKNEKITNSPVFRMTSRFVALIQALINRSIIIS